MNALPQRPKFYLYRSRRFWGGLVVLMLLVSSCLSFPYSAVGLSYRRPSITDRCGTIIFYPPDIPIGVSFDTDHYKELVLHKGTLWFIWNTPKVGSGRWASDEWHGFHHTGVDFSESSFEVPSSPSHKQQGYLTPAHLGIPFWPLPLIWAILWPLWIRRGDKLEEKRFKSLS